jgi:RNA polymerase sigma-B factor
VNTMIDRRAARPDQGLRAMQRIVDQIGTEEDAEIALRTVPRPVEDALDTTPTVDERLWHAHVTYARTQHAGLRRLLVEEYQGYAISLAQRMHREGEPLEDLVQVAFEGLLVALKRFEPHRGIPFVGFATPTIIGSLKRHYRDTGWLLRVPRRVHELAGPARQATEALTGELGRSPSLDETAERLGVDVEDLIVAQEAMNARATTSIDAITNDDGSPRDRFGALDPGMRSIEDLLTLEQALGELDERDREVVRLYFFEEWSQVDIAAHFGVSQMQVSRWIAASLRRLGSWIPAD